MNTQPVVTKVPNKPLWKVSLNKKVVGEIRWFIPNTFQYFPKGSKTGGEEFTSLNKCIESLS